jgi:hypothetical protein
MTTVGLHKLSLADPGHPFSRDRRCALILNARDQSVGSRRSIASIVTIAQVDDPPAPGQAPVA